jgi:hypothetical protein
MAKEVKKTSKPGTPAKASPAPKVAPRNSLVEASEDIKWKAQNAMRTIHEAEMHKKDKELMRHVKAMAKQTMKAVCK